MATRFRTPWAPKKLPLIGILEFLDLINIEKSTKWAELILIAFELDNRKKSTLFLRLTFDKYQEGMPVPWPFRGTVVAMLERTETITIKGWFSNAPTLSLGTLGYLPAEIRLVVWEYVLMLFDGYNHISETTVPAG